MRKWLWGGMTISALLVSGYAIVLFVILGANAAPLIQGKLEQFSLSEWWYAMLYVHIVFSVVALAIGPFALSEKIRSRNIVRHRRLGKLYMLGIGLGGLSGLYLAFYASGGLGGKLGFGVMAVLWLLTATLALTAIRRKQIVGHQHWMIRNYALTLAAVTLRIYLPLFMAFGDEAYFETAYAIIAWMCWVPNLVIAELMVRYMRRKASSHASFVRS